MELYNIPLVPRQHGELRRRICDALKHLPLNGLLLLGDRVVKNFVAKHRRNGQWTDDLGIMCQATALYLERNIHVVGTANSGKKNQGYTILEGGGAVITDKLIFS